jgi:hypothetical protein
MKRVLLLTSAIAVLAVASHGANAADMPSRYELTSHVVKVEGIFFYF